MSGKKGMPHYSEALKEKVRKRRATSKSLAQNARDLLSTTEFSVLLQHHV